MAEVKHKEGRHVGLGFYDLLIEAHYPVILNATLPIVVIAWWIVYRSDWF